MAEESKEVEDPAEVRDSTRRDFLEKAAVAAGALAAAGIASAMLSTEADAAVMASTPVGPKVAIQRAPLQYQKLQNGHAIELKSTELTDILAREGLIATNLKGKQSLMRLEIRYSP